jgi:hypothetical protein
MQEIRTETAEFTTAAGLTLAPPTLGSRRSRFRLGIGSRLALGLAAVAGVIVWGHMLAARTTRVAVDAVQSMQTEHEPLAQKASMVVSTLVAYDRSVIEYLQDGRTSGLGGISAAADALDAAILSYFEKPASDSNINTATPPGVQLLPQLTSHMEHGRVRNAPNGSSSGIQRSTGSNSESTLPEATGWPSAVPRYWQPARLPSWRPQSTRFAATSPRPR